MHPGSTLYRLAIAGLCLCLLNASLVWAPVAAANPDDDGSGAIEAPQPFESTPIAPSAEARDFDEAEIAAEPTAEVPHHELYDVPEDAGAIAAVDGLEEEVGLREENSRYFTDPNGGTHLKQIFLDPIYFEADDGSMKPIDTDIHPNEIGFENGANAFDVTYPDSLSPSQPVTFEFDTGSLSIAPVGTTETEVVPGDGSVRYPGVYDHVDLTYQNTVSGFTKLLKLDSAQAPDTFSFHLSAEGVSLRRDPTLGIVLEKDGVVVGNIPPAYAQDASRDQTGSPVQTFDVTQVLTDLGGGEYEVTISVPRAWLDSPDRVFPVTVDPSLALDYECIRDTDHDYHPEHCSYIEQPNKDTFARWTSGQPAHANTNYTGLPYLAVRNDAAAKAQSFLKFETQDTVLPLGHLLYQADFYIRARFSDALDLRRPVELRRIKSYWNATDVTWNDRPATEGPLSEPGGVFDTVWGCGANATTCLNNNPGSDAWHKFNARELLEEAFLNPNIENNGFRLSVPDGYSNTYKEFDSRNAELSNRRPYLIVQANHQPTDPELVSPTDGASIEADTPPELTIGDVSDVNSDDVWVRFQVAEDPDFDNVIDDSDWVRERRSYTPSPEGDNDFKEGGTYYWRVQATDGLPTHGQPYPVSDPIRSFTFESKKRGTDPRWAMWDYELGNGMVASVNQSNGNFVLEYPLDSLASPGGNLDIKLSYNSQAAKGLTADKPDEIRGPAKGWEISAGPGTAASQIPIRIDPLDSFADPYAVAVVYDSGRRDTYSHAGGGIYKAIGPLAGTLHHLQNDEGWSFTSYSGGEFTFNKGGNLESARPSTSTTDLKGFSYDIDPDKLRVENIFDETAPDLRKVHFSWDSGRLSSVTAVGQRTWTFDYNSNGELASITDPDDDTVNFEYLNGLLKFIQDGQSVVVEADAIPDTTAYKTEIKYLERVVGSQGSRWLVDRVVLPGPNGSTWDFNYPEFFNARGAFAKRTELIAPHVASIDEDFFQTVTEFNEAGLPIEIVQPPMSFDPPPTSMDPDVFPTTVQTWSGTANVTCRRDPLATALSDAQDDQCLSPESTMYEYDNEAPYLLQKVTEPRADTDAGRLVTTHIYDERNSGFDNLRADYWKNTKLKGVPDGSNLAAVSGFGTGSPPPIAGTSELFSVRWQGQIKVPHSGVDSEKEYFFRAELDHGFSAPGYNQDPGSNNDGVRIVVGDELVVNCWPGPTILGKNCNSNGGSVSLSGTGSDEDDGWHTIIVEFAHHSGSAKLDLQWKPTDGTWSSISSESLRPHLGVPTTTKVGVVGDPARFSTTQYTYADGPNAKNARLRGLPTSESTTGPNTVGLTTDYQYDDFGRVIRETNASGAAIVHTYEGICEVRTTDRVGLVTERICNDAGDVTKETIKVDPNDSTKDRVTETAYTDLGRVDYVDLPDEGRTDYDYDNAGRLIREWALVDDRTGTANDVWRQTLTTYTPEGWVDVEMLPSPNISYGMVANSFGPFERDHDYDLAGNEISFTDANAHTWTYKYNGNNLRLEKVSPEGDSDGSAPSDEPDTWRWAYDLAGNVISRKSPAGVSLKRTYDVLSRVRTEFLSSGNSSLESTKYEYDPRGNLLEETDPTNVKVTKTYDALNRVRTETRAVGTKSNDERATMTKETIYDAEGNVDSVTDFQTNKTLYAYDDMGNLERVTLPAENTSSRPSDVFVYERNKVGELIRVEAKRTGGQVIFSVDYAYDKAGRKASMTDGLGNKTSYTYSLVGEPLTVTDARDVVVQYLYDGMGRQTERRAYESADPTLEESELINRDVFTSDGESQVLSASSLQPDVLPGTTSWRRVEVDRDMADRLQEVRSCELAQLGSDPSCETQASQYDYSRYTYDNARLISREDNAVFGTTTYQYDDFGRLKTVKDPFTGLPTTFGYDDAGRVTSRCDSATTLLHQFKHDDPNTGWLERERVVKTGNGDCDVPDNTNPPRVAEFTYDYDPDGAVISRDQFIEKSTDNGSWTYGYLKSGYLKRASFDADGPAGDVQLDYDYDAAGNRVEVASKNPSTGVIDTTHTYFNLAARAYKSTKTATTAEGHTSPELPWGTYQYDEAGNLTEVNEGDRHLTYDYDGHSRLIKTGMLPLAGSTDDPLTFGYLYDGFDRTVVKELRVGLPGAEIRTELSENVYAGTDEAEVVAIRTAVDLPEPQVDPELRTTAISFAAGSPLALRRVTAGTPTSLDPIRFYGVGPHGDVSYLTETNSALKGETVASRTYDPWGDVRSEVEDVTGVLDQAILGFQSDPTDTTTGLVDMGARNYDPALAAFTTVDPLEPEPETPLSYNPYVYGLDDPLSMIDPTGMGPVDEDGITRAPDTFHGYDRRETFSGSGDSAYTERRTEQPNDSSNASMRDVISAEEIAILDWDHLDRLIILLEVTAEVRTQLLNNPGRLPPEVRAFLNSPWVRRASQLTKALIVVDFLILANDPEVSVDEAVARAGGRGVGFWGGAKLGAAICPKHPIAAAACGGIGGLAGAVGVDKVIAGLWNMESVPDATPNDFDSMAPDNEFYCGSDAAFEFGHLPHGYRCE